MVLVVVSTVTTVYTLRLTNNLSCLIHVTRDVLHGGPGRVGCLTPAIACFLAVLTNANRATFSVVPMVMRITGDRGVGPSIPLSVTIMTDRVNVATDPMSTTMITVDKFLRPCNIGCPALLTVYVSAAFMKIVVATFVVSAFTGGSLSSSPICRRHLTTNRITPPHRGDASFRLGPNTGASMLVFLVNVVYVMFCTATVSGGVNVVGPIVFNQGSTVVNFVVVVTTTVAFFYGLSATRLIGADAFGSNLSTYIYMLNMT